MKKIATLFQEKKMDKMVIVKQKKVIKKIAM
jgi:hypothetical protein